MLWLAGVVRITQRDIDIGARGAPTQAIREARVAGGFSRPALNALSDTTGRFTLTLGVVTVQVDGNDLRYWLALCRERVDDSRTSSRKTPVGVEGHN